MAREMVVVLDFGRQYKQLIARRVRECNVYCEIYSYKTDLEKINAMEKLLRPFGIREMVRAGRIGLMRSSKEQQ